MLTSTLFLILNLGEIFPYFTTKYEACCRTFIDLFTRLRKFPSIFYLLRMGIEFCQLYAYVGISIYFKSYFVQDYIHWFFKKKTNFPPHNDEITKDSQKALQVRVSACSLGKQRTSPATEDLRTHTLCFSPVPATLPEQAAWLSHLHFLPHEHQASWEITGVDSLKRKARFQLPREKPPSNTQATFWMKISRKATTQQERPGG